MSFSSPVSGYKAVADQCAGCLLLTIFQSIPCVIMMISESFTVKIENTVHRVNICPLGLSY